MLFLKICFRKYSFKRNYSGIDNEKGILKNMKSIEKMKTAKKTTEFIDDRNKKIAKNA